jgi:hypothetical protein
LLACRGQLKRAGLVERRGMTSLKGLAQAEKRHLASIADMIEESLDELRRRKLSTAVSILDTIAIVMSLPKYQTTETRKI